MINEPFPYFLTVRGVFKPQELNQILEFKKTIEPINGRLGEGDVDLEWRDSTIRWIKCSGNTRWLFDKIDMIFNQCNSQHFRYDINKTDDLQLSEYHADRKGHYGAHLDVGDGVARGRKLSMTMQLSEADSYEGGDLLLYTNSLKPVMAARDRGAVTVFNSMILHEVRPVTKGVRDSLVTWAMGPEWR